MHVPEVGSTLHSSLNASLVFSLDMQNPHAQNLFLLFLSRAWFVFESNGQPLNQMVTPVFLPQAMQKETVSRAKSFSPTVSTGSNPSPAFKILPARQAQFSLREGRGEGTSVPIRIGFVKLALQSIQAHWVLQNQLTAFISAVQKNPEELTHKALPPPTSGTEKRPTLVKTITLGQQELPTAQSQADIKVMEINKTEQTLSVEMLQKDPPQQERGKASLITSGEQLREFIQEAHLSLNLPLTFIVPYPMEKNQETTTDKSQSTQAKKNRNKKGETAKEESLQAMALIPKGPLLLDNGSLIEIEAFAIATTAVTNQQFVLWLNELLQLKQIVFNRGEIHDLHGNLLCQTKEKVPTSQIHTVFDQGELSFSPLRFTQQHPVVHVTFHGVNAFCKSNGFRLPEETEWQRAAGMAVDVHTPKKFTYGCGKDEIDLRWANYRTAFASTRPAENLTRPVGFYNGQTFFAHKLLTCKTELAISPFGCYDMSGNVEEWIAEGIKKGGSYDSCVQELTVSSRRLSTAHPADAFTGFRVAISL